MYFDDKRGIYYIEVKGSDDKGNLEIRNQRPIE